jgi:hypothetical protein
MPKRVGIFVLLASALLVAGNQTDPKPVFPDVTERGRALYEYDQAAWHATDVVQAAHPAQGLVKRYIARKSDAGWTVVFGRLSDQGDKFLIAYKATEGANLQEFSVSKMDPPAEEAGFYLAAAKAIDLADHDFKSRENRPYNAAVLPAPGNQLYVYIYPAQTEAGQYPVGGDVRYLISGDGSSVVDQHRMHKTIVEGWTKPPSSYWIGRYHTHELGDEVEDSDVFHVLSSKVVEYIGMPNKKFFRVNTDGTIVEVKKPGFSGPRD